MGIGRFDQMQGTPGEQLSELAGRVCYDSLGQGRDSEGYHKHISEVNHGSVREHYNYCINIKDGITAILMRECLNRPGVWVTPNRYGIGVRLCLNLRAAYEWQPHDERDGRRLANTVHESLAATAFLCRDASYIKGRSWAWEFAEPAHEEEQWISLYMSGSRGFSHEQVRHKWRTAVSQRSTRYCDESETPWCEHPLTLTLADDLMKAGCSFIIKESQQCYRSLVYQLQSKLTSRGVDKLTARKQARGAARGYLGNALQTEMIFSASVAQWKRMLRQRLHPAADAEIRLIYADVLRILQDETPYDFTEFAVVPSPDGLGVVLA